MPDPRRPLPRSAAVRAVARVAATAAHAPRCSWCGHCKSLAPEWTKLAGAMDALKLVTVAAVDADANKGMGAAFEVKGFPTIVLTLDGKKARVDAGAASQLSA